MSTPGAKRRTREGFRRFFTYLEETGLKVPLRERAMRQGGTLFGAYTDDASPASVAARLEAWWYLVAETARSPEQVATLFDRDRASVAHGLRLLREAAEERTVAVAPDTVEVLARVAARPRPRAGS